MKRFVVGIVGSLFLMFLMVRYSAGQQARTFTGEITDEQLNCIQTPMKAPEGVNNNKHACILYWAHYNKPPSKYVLYDAATKTTYQLDDQDKVQPFIGAKVRITGTESNKMIKVANIKADESAYKGAAG